jgi:hypothetical protein
MWFLLKQKAKPFFGREPSPLRPFVLAVQALTLRKLP